MRARELLQEDYNQSLEADVDNMLVGAKGNGATQINMQDLVFQLQNMGYSVSPHSLMTLLMRNPNVLNATAQQVTLKCPEDAMQPGGATGQDSAGQVSDMAQKATKI